MEGRAEDGRRRGLSLEQKVPLLITGLLIALLSVTVAVAHREVEASARVAGDERLERIAMQISEIVQGAVTQRMALLLGAASHDHIRAVLADAATPDTAALRELLEPLATPANETNRVELLDSEGRIVFTLGASDAELGGVPRDAITATQQSGYGRWIDTGELLLTQAAAPVSAGDRTVGHLLHLRPFANPGAAAQLEEMVGQPGSVFFVQDDGRWFDLYGDRREPPMTAPTAGPLTYQRPGGETYIARATPVPGTPWLVLAELPISVVLVGPSAFLQRMAALLLLITSLGAAGAWLLSRRFTRPLRELSHAAGTIASGDYSRRVGLDRSDELGMLADSFNSMAAQVQGGDAELKRQIDQARQLADELEGANEQLRTLMREAEAARRTAEAASHAKSDFLATVSHEIRTPINAIIGYTDLLLLGIPDPPTPNQAEQLRRVHESGTRLTRLIDDVLDLAKIESGHLIVELSRGVAEDAIRAAISMTEPLAARKGVELVPLPDLRARTLYAGDPGRVEQILVNLVGNAVKFTQPGGRVTVGCGAITGNGGAPGQPRSVRITVEDTGPGIPFEKQELIFDRFVQGDSGYRRQHEGVGLGLAISRELARLMGGDITVTSDPGSGASFTLTLPANETTDRSISGSTTKTGTSSG